ncbi:bifunctional 2-C-methyl-D-erythritol 4-phosphate cytidylyltransferase/2-C-methyl-D-erythritol 2,4-cyclodiphosphate synthase [Litorimonas sp. WD9-15]|uniref:bifunctional 2-C-methyl-D-erythritol 4-phosphate cytidylyltransferase/2-C-methyl-D-erythritol 2,4-cyclodiphosphate synthase n=1 Tax=Litorimonas sp. WD9-15 TaxID=3418716 RepID=UPI003CFE5979
MTRDALILVAAGKGMRAGGDIPKQYRRIGSQPLLVRTLQNALKAHNFGTIIVVISADDDFAEGCLAPFGDEVRTTIGGATRTDSVRAGLNVLQGERIDHVYIHDAARPFLTQTLLQDLSNALETHQATAPALPIADALKTLEGDSVDRDALRRVQTPQAFRYADILSAFDAAKPGESHADDIAVARAAGLSLSFTSGDPDNFKVTYPEDFAKAERMVDQTYTATGSGFDVHQFDFESNDPLWLCGVPINCGYTLKGHSDADAGLHALTDAILGALCFGDIGDHFPPSDPQWKGASSDKFLLFAMDKVKERKGLLQHVDVTLICEQPKIKPHREAMREKIAELCGLPLSRVSVKATTTEKLGFTGRGEGLAAQAVATVRLGS